MNSNCPENSYYLADCRCYDGAVKIQIGKPDVILGLNVDSVPVAMPYAEFICSSSHICNKLQHEINVLKKELVELKLSLCQLNCS